MKKLLTTLLCCLLLAAVSYANNEDGKGIITGKVLTSDGEPATSVTVALKGTKRGTITNEHGRFVLRNVNEGDYELEISLTGYENITQKVTVEKDKTAAVTIELAISKKQLEEVVVTAGRNKFADKKTDYVARMPLSNLENPQVYSVVSQELLKEQVITDARDAIKNIPGAALSNYPAGGFAITTRGFTTGINARNGMETVASRASIEIANVERIEVLKGPSGTLFGSTVSSFGGVVNLVTKKPMETFKGEISYTSGSYGLNRLAADVNAPLNKDKTVLLRVNTALNRQNSFLEYGHNNSFIIAPGLLFKATDKLTILADAEVLAIDQTRITYTRTNPRSGFSTPDDIPLPYNKSLYMDDANAKTVSGKFFLEGRYQISKNWTSSTLYSNVNERAIQSYQYYPTWIAPDSVARNILNYGPINNEYINFQENINGEFKTGSIGHKLLIGFNYRYYNGSFVYYTPSGTKVVDTVDIKKPFVALSKEKLDAFLTAYGSAVPFATSPQKTISIYATDVVNFTDRLSAMLSLRVDRYDYKGTTPTNGYKQTSLAPKLGLVYQVVKNQVSVFANYMSGFQNQAPITQPVSPEYPSGGIFVPKPTYANQTEGGIKAEAFNKKLSATISYYYIEIANTIRKTLSGVSVQDGNQVSKGLDVELIANPIAGLNIYTGYAWNDNRLIKTSEASKNLEGNKMQSAPESVANMWVSYKFQHTALKNIILGFGGNYVGKAYFATDNVYYFPEYTVLNASVGYDQPKWNITLKANNLTGKKYWDLAGAPQMLRNFAGSIAFKF